MAASLAIIVLLGLGANKLFRKIKLPGILGMLILGVLIGPYGMNWLSNDLMNVSADFRKIALIIILLRAGLGAAIGFVLIKVFHTYHIRDSKKVLIILGIGILLTAIEDILKGKIEIAALLGVMTIGFIILEKKAKVAKRLAMKFNKIWIFAEILLFVLVGAQVNTGVALHAGIQGIIIIFFGLIGRSMGVILSTLGTNLNWKERLFCVIAYSPKATVQAAIGAVPLSMGVASGEVILAIAVLSILITAPLGATGIKLLAEKLL